MGFGEKGKQAKEDINVHKFSLKVPMNGRCFLKNCQHFDRGLCC